MSDESKPLTLAEKLNSTGNKLSELSRKVANSTKSVVGNANDSIKSAINENKQKRDIKKQKKLEEARQELSSEGLLNDVPSMVTLPEFEQERMSLVSEQNDNLIMVLEEMQRLSERVDMIEKRKHKTEKIESVLKDSNIEVNNNERNEYTSPVMTEVIHLLGASLLFIILLLAFDNYLSKNEIMITKNYPAEIISWSVGSTCWALYLLHRLGHSSNALKLPVIIKFQTALAVGITTSFGILMNDDSMKTISNVWTWGTVIAIALLLTSSLIAFAWNSTKKLVSVKQITEIID